MINLSHKQQKSFTGIADISQCIIFDQSVLTGFVAAKRTFVALAKPVFDGLFFETVATACQNHW